MKANSTFGNLLHRYNDHSLTIIFSDGSELSIAHDEIDDFSEKYLADPVKVPAELKEATEYQACDICPKKKSGEFCHALRPTLPFIEIVDKYVSCDRVTTIYKGGRDCPLHITSTDMQHALQYLSLLSLAYYCEVGRKYWKLFAGVMPLMSVDDLVWRLYLNAFWISLGDKEKTKQTIEMFNREINVTAKCQIDRLALLCRNDAFLNAFTQTLVATEILKYELEEVVSDVFKKFEHDGFC